MLSSCLGKSSMPRHRKAELGKLQLPSLPPLRAWKTLIDQAGVREYFEPMSPCRQFPDDVFIAIAIHNLKPPANAAFPVLSATGQYGDFYWLSMALVLCCIWVRKRLPRSEMYVPTTIHTAPSWLTKDSYPRRQDWVASPHCGPVKRRPSLASFPRQS